MSIISYAEAEAFLDDQLSEGNLDFPLLCDAVESFVSSYCKRTFDSTAHQDHYNGTGLPKLYLYNYPVTDLTRLAIGRRDAVRVCNTNTSGTATVTANSTGLVLTYNGTADSTCTFATYTTLTTLVAAVSAVSGWSAELTDSNFGAYPSTELVPSYGKSCIDGQYVYLEMPDVAEYDFELDPERGIIELPGVFPSGVRNVRVDYTAGYDAADMPEDLKAAVKILVKDWWEKRSESSFNLSSYAVGGMSKQIVDSIPPEAKRILESYRRYAV